MARHPDPYAPRPQMASSPLDWVLESTRPPPQSAAPPSRSSVRPAPSPVVQVPRAQPVPSVDVIQPAAMLAQAAVPAYVQPQPAVRRARPEGGGVLGNVLIGFAISLGCVWALHRNDVLLEIARRMHRENDYLRAEHALVGGPGFGTPRSLDTSAPPSPASVALAPVAAEATVAVAAPTVAAAAPKAAPTAAADAPAEPAAPAQNAADEEAAPAAPAAPRPRFAAPTRHAAPSKKAAAADAPGPKGTKAVALTLDEEPGEKPAKAEKPAKTAKTEAAEAPPAKAAAAVGASDSLLDAIRASVDKKKGAH